MVFHSFDIFGILQCRKYRKKEKKLGMSKGVQTFDLLCSMWKELKRKRTAKYLRAVCLSLSVCVYSIHPRDKQDVAYRLVLGARAVAYEEAGVSFQGPFPSQVRIENTTIIIIYNQAIRSTLSSDTFEVLCHWAMFLFAIKMSGLSLWWWWGLKWQIWSSFPTCGCLCCLHYRYAALRRRNHVTRVPNGFLFQWRNKEVIMSCYQ